MLSRKRSIPSKEEEVAISEEEEEDEVLTMDEETIKERNVLRKIGVIGARPEPTLLPTAGARRRTTNEHKTKE